jgi:diguanylate cyclase (GGDEF)-like protein
VNADKANAVLRAIARNPRSSAQDLLLLTGAMIGAVLLTLEYELFSFAEQLTVHERRITLEESIFLTVLLAAGIAAFIVRRLREERRDLESQIALSLEMRELREQALNDSLTGLPNRRSMLAKLAEATGPHSDGHRHAFFLLDLNEFKRVNDVHGHAVAVGDRVLQLVVERFKSASRPSDVLARLGGDEFAVLVYDVGRESACAIGQRFISALKTEVWVEGNPHDVGVSIGVTLIPEDGVTTQEILRNADIAMYRAKEAGASALEFFYIVAADSAQRISIA